MQVVTSIFLVSFPSIPVFFFLAFLGKLLRKKDEASNFSQSLLNKMIAFSCGTLLGDVFLHVFPFLYTESKDSHSHDH